MLCNPIPELPRNKNAFGGYAGLDAYARLLQSPPPDEPWPIKTIAGMQQNETWAATNASIAADTADAPYGLQSRAVTVNAGATSSVTCTLPLAASIRGNAMFLLKIDDLTKVDNIVAYVYESDTVGRYNYVYRRSVEPVNEYRFADGVWTLCIMRREQISIGQGTPTAWQDWSGGEPTGGDEYAITKIRIDIYAASGESPVVKIGGVFSQDFPKAGVIFQFDDGYSSVYELAYPRLLARGWRGAIACVPSLLDTSGKMTTAQVQELYDAGWDITAHGYTHTVHNSSTTVADQIEELQQCQAALRQAGWHRGSDFWTWPGGVGDNVERNAVPYVSTFYKQACRRTVHNSTAPLDTWLLNYADTWFHRNRFATPCIPYSESAWTNFIATYLPRAIRLHHVALILTHRILVAADPGNVNDCNVTNFETLLDYVQTQVDAGEAEVLTHTDRWERTAANIPAYME